MIANIEEQILSAYRSEDFFTELYQIYSQEKGNKESLCQTMASLHNCGKIDLAEEILKISNQGYEFFDAKELFENTLPDVNFTVEKSMECVRHIFAESGNDMTADMVFNSFIEYCKKDENRVKDTLQIINSDTNWYNFLTSAIIAGSEFSLDKYAKLAITFTSHSDTNVCRASIYSLGKLQYQNNPSALNQAFQAIEVIIEKSNSTELLPVSIETICILSTFDSKLKNQTIRLLKLALKNADDNILLSTSKSCFSLRKKLLLEVFDVLLAALEKVNHRCAATMTKIDLVLLYLLEENQDKVIAYLENTLAKNTELSIKQFDLTLGKLRQKYNKLLNIIITKWLVVGKMNLCKAASEIATDKMILTADIEQLKRCNNIAHLFVARKAIGWLFFHQTSAVSFIVSMIEVLDEDTSNVVEDLLFDPLLVSYPGSGKKYLSSIDESQSKAKKIALKLLKKLEEHHSRLESAWNIKELHPSQAQREAYYRFHDQEMLKAMKKARKNSTFLSLVSEVIVLYGEESVTYHPKIDDTKEHTRHEMNFQKTKYSIEHPSIDFIDPHGLDYMLRVFRCEQLKHEVNH